MLTLNMNYYSEFYPDQYYHIYNRGNNREKIFFEPGNYPFFLRRLDEYLLACIELFAFCLLQNHFHLLVKVKDKTSIHEQFRLFFLSYSKAINKQSDRTGSLFQKRFKRIIIEGKPSLCRTIVYIHTNPVHHKIKYDFQNYKYSSFQEIISDKETRIKREEVLSWFGGYENFITQHQERLTDLNLPDIDLPDF
jgi:putative transposase